MPYFYLCCTHCIIPQILLNHPNSYHEECSSLMKNSMQICCSIVHFECDGHRAHMLTQQHLPPSLTSTVKSSLFTHAYSRPLSLVAGYLDVTQIILILTIVGLFPERLYIYTHTHTRRDPKMEFIYKKFIITCLNFSHFLSTFHLFQQTYQDIFSTAPNSF